MARNPITPPDMNPKSPKSEMHTSRRDTPKPKSPKGSNAMGGKRR